MTPLAEIWGLVKKYPIIAAAIGQIVFFTWTASAFNARVEAVEAKASAIASMRDDVAAIKINTDNLKEQVGRLFDYIIKQNAPSRGR